MKTFEPNEYIIEKLDKIEDRLTSIDVTLARNTASLVEHMKRSEANEKAVEILKTELKPVVTHVALVQVLGKGAFALLTSGIVVKVIIMLIGR